MLWLQDTNGDQTAISGAFEVAITETQGSFDQLSFKFVANPTDAEDSNYVAASMMLPRTIIVEPVTGKKFRILQSQPESLGDKLLYTVTCTSIAYDLHDTYIETKLQNTQSLANCLDLITNGTNFKYHVTGSFANYSFGEGFGGDFADTLLSNLANDFGFEFYFDNYVIHIKSTIGKSGAFLFVEGGNAGKFTINEDYSTITTYIKGYGKQNDDGSYACTAEYTSPLASTWGKIWAEPYPSDSITDSDTLLAKLKAEIHDYPDVQYSMDYVDFKNNLEGFVNDSTVGNYGYLRNRFGIDITVRVQSRTYYPQDTKNAGSITFGNKIFDPNIFINNIKKAQSDIAKNANESYQNSKNALSNSETAKELSVNTANKLNSPTSSIKITDSLSNQTYSLVVAGGTVKLNKLITYPSNAVIMGNSLTKYYSIGLAATDYEHDYYYLLCKYFKSKVSGFSSNDRSNVYQWEIAETSGDRQTAFETYIKPLLSSNTEFVLIQLGENVNSDTRKATFESDAETLLKNIRKVSPSAVIMWIYGWFNDSDVFSDIKTACTNQYATFVDLSSLNTSANQATVGQACTNLDGSTYTITANQATHPGDSGMQAIADRVIEYFNG